MTDNKFLWVPFYKECASKLLQHREDRKKLLDFIYATLPQNIIGYLHEEDQRKLEDICPFTTMGIFNRGTTPENRKRIASVFKKFLNINADIPSQFDGIPTLNNQKSLFFGFSDKRDSNDIENLWELFEEAQKKEPYNIEEIFNIVIKQYVIKNNITMGLYWINPEKFIALDSSNRNSLKTYGVEVKGRVSGFQEYLSIIKQVEEKMKSGEIKERSFIEFSYNAFDKNASEDSIDSGSDSLEDLMDLLKYKHQIILQGAPGTGKTYTAKDIAEKLIFGKISDKEEQAERLKGSEQFKLIQFHPSYTYEDFVRGIEIKTENGQTEYVSKNKTLGKFAKDALKNWEDSHKTTEEVSKEEWLNNCFQNFADFVSEKADSGDYALTENVQIISVDDDAFRYAGNHRGTFRMLFKDLKQAYIDDNNTRQEITQNPNLSSLAHKYASYYIRVLDNFRNYLTEHNLTHKTATNSQKKELKNYVLIIDEINRANLPAVLGELIYALEYRGEKVESMYAVDGDNGLILPPNLYIIGTMNTADRSVGQIDYAIRRRFAFVGMLPISLKDVEGFDEDLFKEVSAFFIKNVDEYISNPDSTNLIKSEWLSDEFRPEDVWIGHSYFIMNDDNRDFRLNYEIKPILREYLKDGIFKESVNGQDTKSAINSL